MRSPHPGVQSILTWGWRGKKESERNNTTRRGLLSVMSLHSPHRASCYWNLSKKVSQKNRPAIIRFCQTQTAEQAMASTLEDWSFFFSFRCLKVLSPSLPDEYFLFYLKGAQWTVSVACNFWGVDWRDGKDKKRGYRYARGRCQSGRRWPGWIRVNFSVLMYLFICMY